MSGKQKIEDNVPMVKVSAKFKQVLALAKIKGAAIKYNKKYGTTIGLVMVVEKGEFDNAGPMIGAIVSMVDVLLRKNKRSRTMKIVKNKYNITEWEHK